MKTNKEVAKNALETVFEAMFAPADERRKVNTDIVMNIYQALDENEGGAITDEETMAMLLYVLGSTGKFLEATAETISEVHAVPADKETINIMDKALQLHLAILEGKLANTPDKDEDPISYLLGELVKEASRKVMNDYLEEADGEEEE